MATTEVKNSIFELDDMPSMDALLGGNNQKTGATAIAGTVIKGKIAKKLENEAFIDIGYKADGRVSKDEFADWNNVAEGQEIDVYLEDVEDEDSLPVISVRKAQAQKSWDELVANYKEGDIIKGIVRHRVRGGLIVDVGGVDAFLPGSQVELGIGTSRNNDDLLNQEIEFKILKIVADRKNIVLSRRELLEANRAEQRGVLLNELTKGEIRTGTVKNITDFGAFIDLNGMDGLLHITDMSWGRVSHPEEMLKVGEKIEVMILDIDRERQRISLGLKQKEGNPWDTVQVKYPIGSRVKGKVVNLMPYGAFIELEEGIEGLIHVSEMSWTKKINKASDVLALGDEVEAVVLDVQVESQKISLGLRQTMENPWTIIAEKFPKGSKIKGKVRNMTSYGAFIQIQDDVDGMIHVSDMSWTRKINTPQEVLQKGQEVEAIILDIDPDQQRISLGLKQLAEDPWANIEDYYKVGDEIEGKVSKLASFGAFVELANGIDGLIHISQLSDERVQRVKDILQVGQSVKARVVKIDTKERRIGLSLKTGAATHSTARNTNEGSSNDLRPGEAMVDLGSVFDAAQDASDKE